MKGTAAARPQPGNGGQNWLCLEILGEYRPRWRDCKHKLVLENILTSAGVDSLILMATENQIVANQLNSKKSTGPKTSEGKEAIKHNAFPCQPPTGR